MWNYFSTQFFPAVERAVFFGRFPGFAHLPFWRVQIVDGDEYGEWVE